MSKSDSVQPVRAPWFGATAPEDLPRAAKSGVPEEEPDPVDRVELTEHHGAVLELLRERILTRTRTELGLDATQGEVRFVAAPTHRLEPFVGRLVAAQNMLVAQRRGVWPDARIDRAVHRATRQGVVDAIDILAETEHLDAEAWSLMDRVLHELARRSLASDD